MSADNLVHTAIENKQLIEFNYDGLHRIAEPHVYGIKDGEREILVYQVAGQSSSGNLPNWRRMKISKISGIIISDQHFAGPRPYPSGKHSSFDKILAVVK
ncbi:MAG: hypothetical protein WBF38_01310 [Nitrosotalea sp.]